jgi:hypothetical protein
MASKKMDKEFVKCGSLQKRSQNKGRIVTSENYKRRFFVLSRNALKYFEGRFEVGIYQLLSKFKFSFETLYCPNKIDAFQMLTFSFSVDHYS